MHSPFFPNLTFGWTYLGLLFILALVAAWVDTRLMIIPKWITFPMAGLGLAINLARGAWLGSQGHELWLIGSEGLWSGLLDGFLYSLLGFLVGFTMLFIMWILKTCGGGDVKLFGAVGAWVGPENVLYVLSASIPALIVIMVIKAIAQGVFSKEPAQTEKPKREWSRKPPEKTDPEPPPKPRISYSLPVAIALAVVLLWQYRFELKLMKPKPTQQGSELTHVS